MFVLARKVQGKVAVSARSALSRAVHALPHLPYLPLPYLGFGQRAVLVTEG